MHEFIWILIWFHMDFHHFHMILYGFHMILHECHMILYAFHIKAHVPRRGQEPPERAQGRPGRPREGPWKRHGGPSSAEVRQGSLKSSKKPNKKQWFLNIRCKKNIKNIVFLISLYGFDMILYGFGNILKNMVGHFWPFFDNICTFDLCILKFVFERSILLQRKILEARFWAPNSNFLTLLDVL